MCRCFVAITCLLMSVACSLDTIQDRGTVSADAGLPSADAGLPPADASNPEGTLRVTLTQTPAGTINADGSYDFIYTITAITTQDETYQLKPFVQPPAGSLGFAWKLGVLDTAGVPLTEVVIPKGAPAKGTARQVLVRLAIPSGVSGDVKLSLLVQSKRNTQLVGSSCDHSFTLGSTTQAPSILLSRTLLDPISALSGDEIQTAPGAKATLQFAMTISVAGTYTVALSLPNDPDNKWGARQITGGTPNPLMGRFTTTGPGTINLLVGLQPTATAPITADMVLRVASTSDTAVFGQVSQRLRRL